MVAAGGPRSHVRAVHNRAGRDRLVVQARARYRGAMRGMRGVLVGAAVAVTLTGVAAADLADVYTTRMLSTAPDGAPGDGPSAHAVISQDRRAASVVAFDSLATNLVPGDVNGQSDVFVRERAGGFGPDGDPWAPAALRLISRGLGGQPADGPSTLPALSGDSRNPPRCVAFVSAASNLVAGDTNGKPDAFLADLASGRITRVSLGSDGRQSNGTTYEVAVDGRCRRVAFIADATNLAAVKGRTPTSKAMRTSAVEPAGSRQVYVRGIGGPGLLDRDLTGVTWAVSRTRSGRPSNGVASHVQMTPNGMLVAYDSTAPDLVARDDNGTRDVFEAVMTRRFLAKFHHHRPQAVSIAQRLVSATSDGAAGNGPSFHPALNNDGSRMAFVTGASNLIAGARPERTQIAWADPTKNPPALALASHTRGAGGAPGDGPSDNPSMTAAGTWILYDTAATNIPPTAAQGGPAAPRTVMVWMSIGQDEWVVSNDSADVPLPGPSTAGRTSAHGNYMIFLSGSPAQVMLRYLGPK